MEPRLTLLATARSSTLLDVRFEDDRPLDDTGWHEVQRVVPALSYLAAAELRYCSPSTRCRETASVLGLTALAQPALRDCDMGRWRGRSLAEITTLEPQAFDAWLADPYSAPHGGESLMAFISRIGGWLDTRPIGGRGYGYPQVEGSGGGWIVAVAEPAVVRAALCYALQTPPQSYWRIDVQSLSAVTLSGRPGEWKLAL